MPNTGLATAVPSSIVSASQASASTQYPITLSNNFGLDDIDDRLDPLDPNYASKQALRDKARKDFADSEAEKLEADFTKKAAYLLRKFVNEPSKEERKKIFDKSSESGFIDFMMDVVDVDPKAFPGKKYHVQEDFYEDLEKTAAEIRDQGIRIEMRRDGGENSTTTTTAAPVNSTTTASGGFSDAEQKKNIGIGTGVGGGVGAAILGFLKYWCGGNGNRNGGIRVHPLPLQHHHHHREDVAARAAVQLACCCIETTAHVIDRELERRQQAARVVDYPRQAMEQNGLEMNAPPPPYQPHTVIDMPSNIAPLQPQSQQKAASTA